MTVIYEDEYFRGIDNTEFYRYDLKLNCEYYEPEDCYKDAKGRSFYVADYEEVGCPNPYQFGCFVCDEYGIVKDEWFTSRDDAEAWLIGTMLLIQMREASISKEG